MVSGPHSFWDFSQAPQTLYLGPELGSLSLTHPSCVPALVNGNVHLTLQPDLGCLSRHLLSLHSVYPLPLSICLQASPCISPLSFQCYHVATLLSLYWSEALQKPSRGPFPTLSLSSPSHPIFLQPEALSLHPNYDLITPLLKIPSRFGTTLGIKSTLVSCSHTP